jgi:hypothetical protein
MVDAPQPTNYVNGVIIYIVISVFMHLFNDLFNLLIHYLLMPCVICLFIWFVGVDWNNLAQDMV